MAGRARKPVSRRTYSGKLAVRLRELRESKGYTIEGLATKIGISTKAMYAYENGSRGIPVDLFPKLAKALGASGGEFFPPL